MRAKGSMKPKVLEAYLAHDFTCECFKGKKCSCGLHSAIKSTHKRSDEKRMALAQLLRSIEKTLKVLCK